MSGTLDAVRRAGSVVLNVTVKVSPLPPSTGKSAAPGHTPLGPVRRKCPGTEDLRTRCFSYD